MRRFLALALMVLITACSGPTGPAEPEGPSFVRVPRAGSYVTPSGATCGQVFELAYIINAGNQAYWRDYYQVHCYYDDGTVAPTPTPTPTYPAPTPTPTCVYGRAGCTKTSGNN